MPLRTAYTSHISLNLKQAVINHNKDWVGFFTTESDLRFERFF